MIFFIKTNTNKQFQIGDYQSRFYLNLVKYNYENLYRNTQLVYRIALTLLKSNRTTKNNKGSHF